MQPGGSSDESSSAAGRPVRAVVVGGGISGLAAAWELLNRDDVDDVTVLERAGRVGGVLAGGDLGGCPVDLGAEALLCGCRPAP
jgi:oxygen-dependent protoporphyrinogen oxidase